MPTSKRLRWVGGVSRWYVEHRGDETHWIERREDGYHAWAKGRSLGVFPSVILAGDACEVA